MEQLKPIAARYGKMLAQLAIAWNLCQPEITTALTGAKRPEQIAHNVARVREQLGTYSTFSH